MHSGFAYYTIKFGGVIICPYKEAAIWIIVALSVPGEL